MTGGTGHLGRAIVQRLISDGRDVRVLSRRPGVDASVEWVRGDLATQAGVEAAVDGVDVVVHAATDSLAARRGRFRMVDFLRSPTRVDIEGTNALVSAAEQNGVQHFVHVSIVGLEHMALLPYSRVKAAAEKCVRDSAVPWSVVRATGYFWTLEVMLANLSRRRVLLLPGQVLIQPVDSADVAEYVVGCVRAGARGVVPDFGGPEVLTMRQLAEQYLAERNLRRRIWNIPLPRPVRRGLEAGSIVRDGQRGKTTWKDWLRGTSAVRTTTPAAE